MRTVAALSVLLIALPAIAQNQAQNAPAAKSGPMLDDWNALLTGGCDLEKAHVRTPIEARVLRNAPYAAKGYTFKSAELTALYAADGGWYAPDPKVKAPKFTPAEGACIKKLKTHEQALRKAITIDKAFETRFTAQHEAVKSLRFASQGLGGPVWRVKKWGAGKDITWELGDDSCKNPNEEGQCNVIQLICTEAQCLINAPG